jgi:parallel beta-helix repeat protein
MVLNNYHGMYLSDSSNYNTLASNTASNNYCGIYLYSSCDNDVTCNLVQNNTDCGIYLTSGSTGNNITWNNLVANGELQTDGSYPYQFNNSQSDGVDAINNFWGAGMNNSTIDASIYDDEEGRAEVKFYPFETRPVPCAPAPISEESPAFTTVDAVIALEMAVGSCPTDLHWDVSGDGQVTSLDALMIAMGARTG